MNVHDYIPFVALVIITFCAGFLAGYRLQKHTNCRRCGLQEWAIRKMLDEQGRDPHALDVCDNTMTSDLRPVLRLGPGGTYLHDIMPADLAGSLLDIYA